MGTKKMTITPPDGYEIDKEKSTLSEIVFKKIEKEVKVWEDIDRIKGTYIDGNGIFKEVDRAYPVNENKNIFIDDIHAKSALAMAQISQLMPYYGGEITKDEWYKALTCKFCIVCSYNSIYFEEFTTLKTLLAFHTPEQRQRFYKNNKQLVHDYLMIED